MNALIDLAVIETNQAYANSGVSQRVRLVHRAELAGFVESGNWGADLGHVQNPHDGVLDEVPVWRAQCGADAVVLIEDTSTSCGVAFLMGTLDPAFAPYAFCIVSRTCATGYYTFGHELGHVMGLAHDRDNSSIKTSRASVSASSQSANAPSYSPVLSGDGRFVAFLSDAGNLVAGDANGFDDVFVRDTLNRTTLRVNVSTSNAEANGAPLSAPAISRDGRYVAFDSFATSLVAGDTNGVADVFVRDTQSNVTTRGSVGPAGAQANGPSYGPAISGDGRFVAFTSEATNIVPGPPPSSGTQVYVFDRNTGTVALASASTSGTAGSGASTRAAISADGRFTAFTSTAADLVPNDTNGRSDIFVRDLLLGTTERASTGAGGAQANGDSPYAPGISGDGRFVVFSSLASNLVHGDQNGTWDVFVFDRATTSTVRASVALSGTDGDGPSGWTARPSISDDGRYVAFGSRATNLVGDDTNGVDDVFRRDLQLGTTTRVSVTPSGNQGHATSGTVDQNTTCSIAPSTAAAVAFVSSALLDVLDANGQQDVYVFLDEEPNPPGIDSYSYGYRTSDEQWRTIMAYAPGTRVQYFSNPSASFAGQALGIADPSPYSAEAWRTLNNSASTVAGFTSEILVTFCFGDGSGTPCPCGNASAPGDESGCANSLGLEGRLVAQGTASLANDAVVLSGTGMPNSGALYFQGTAQQSGGAGAVFGDGLRCVGGNVRRLGTKINASNASALPSSGDPALSVLGAIASPGTVHYQVWYRNADPSFCTPSTFNWTNGVSVSWSL
jgi:Tol biopolymer transport system component